MSILQFNINLEPNDVVSYIQQPQPQPQQFIKEIKQLSSVSFTKTINSSLEHYSKILITNYFPHTTISVSKLKSPIKTRLDRSNLEI